MTTITARKMDHWIRHDFKQINSELEELYFSQDNREVVEGVGNSLKNQLFSEGNALVKDLLREGNTDEGFDNGFDLLGNVGLFMAACRRHELTNPAKEKRSPLSDISALSMQLGASLGVAPRFASAHLETHNFAHNGLYKTFTDLPDERIFLDHNTRGVLAFIRASEALLHALPLGISHPVTYDLLKVALGALEDVVRTNQMLFDELDTARFFYCIRPYYKPHKVGMHEYRGANAGDFAGINVLDLLLGVCRADDPYYSQLLVDKFLFMRPEQQLILRDCMRRQSLLDGFLQSLDNGEKNESWYQKNLGLFLQVCKAHGDTAKQHHQLLIKKFIEQPADKGELTHHEALTASGPPLPVLLKGLQKLCDLRSAADVPDIPTRFADFERLKYSLSP